MEKSTPTFKILILGQSGVGKSCVFSRFVEDQYHNEINTTVGSDLKTKKITVDDVEVKLAIWDTAGQERFLSLTPMLYRNSHCAILMYDITNRKSFLKLNTWLELIRSSTEDMVLMVVGNKVDLEQEREVSQNEGRNFAKEINSLFMETSAKTSAGVNEAFIELVRKALQTQNLYQPQNSVVSLTDTTPNNKSFCSWLKCGS